MKCPSILSIHSNCALKRSSIHYFPQMMPRIFSKHFLSVFIIGACFLFAVKTAAQTPSLAEQVFQKHQTILLSEDVQAVLPEVILELKKPENQPLLTPAIIEAVLDQPDLLKVIFPDIGDEFITLLKQEDSDLRILLSDPDVQTLLQTPDAIDELIVLLDMETRATVKIIPTSTESPDVGEQFAIAIVVDNAQNIRGYQLAVQFDPEALGYVSWQQGTYLSGDVLAFLTAIKTDQLSFVATAPTQAERTHGVLLTITFEVVGIKASTLSLSEVTLVSDEGIALPVKTEDGEIVEPMPTETEDTEIVEPMPEEAADTETVEPTQAETEDIEIVEPSTPAWDVNQDGVVNVLDLLLVTADFGQAGPIVTDVNGDSVVNILDLRLVANHLGEQYE